MAELWKEVKGYEGYYAVSSLGRVKSLYRVTISPSGKRYTCQEKFLSSAKRKDGYQYVMLCREGKGKLQTIHRLVATAFIPNPSNLPYINHKDENPSNNCVDNLEWCTAMYNNHYGNHLKRLGEASKKWHSSDEGRQQRSEIMKNFYATHPNPNKGKKRTEEQKRFMKERQAEGIRKWKKQQRKEEAL